ncbi:MAG: hypothetical protein M0T84_14925 [Betaproteobacteria bacterium]|nr:hypothetical protein [Betaproteobacteria bacterium]
MVLLILFYFFRSEHEPPGVFKAAPSPTRHTDILILNVFRQTDKFFIHGWIFFMAFGTAARVPPMPKNAGRPDFRRRVPVRRATGCATYSFINKTGHAFLLQNIGRIARMNKAEGVAISQGEQDKHAGNAGP